MIYVTVSAVNGTMSAFEGVQENLEQLKPNVVLETLKGWLPGMASFGFKILAALAILFIGSRLIRVFYSIMDRSFERMEMEVSLRKFLLSVIQAGAYCILAFIIAGQIGINSASIIALLGSAGIAVGLAVQGSLANFAGGVLILMMKPFRVGDYIISKDGEGTVTVIGLVYTTLDTPDNRRVVIPNGNLANSPLTNVTARDKRRVDISVGIGYGSDLKTAKEMVYQIYAAHPNVLSEEAIDTFVDSLGDNCVVIGGRGWVATEDYWSTRWDILETIKLEFDRAGIEIPFSQLDVHIKG